MSEISPTARVRLLGDDAPATPPPVAASAPGELSDGAAPPRAERSADPIFLADAAEGADVLEAGRIVQPLAQLCVAGQVQTPFLAAIAGPGGSGKTFALSRLAETAEKLAGSSGALGRVVVARVDAADGAEAPVALASAAYAALDRGPAGVDYAPLLDESAHAGGDPLRAAMAASDHHDEIVRRLEAERAQRDDAEARRARLADALLFETPGSRVDVFARTRRGSIDSRLRRFDLAGFGRRRELPRPCPGRREHEPRRPIGRRAAWDLGLSGPAQAHLLGGRRIRSRLRCASHPRPAGAGRDPGRRTEREPSSPNSTSKATDWVEEPRLLVRDGRQGPLRPRRPCAGAEPLAGDRLRQPAAARRPTPQPRRPRPPPRPRQSRCTAQPAGRGDLSGRRGRGQAGGGGRPTRRRQGANPRAGTGLPRLAPQPRRLGARIPRSARRADGPEPGAGRARAADLRRSTISTPCRQRRRSPGSTRRRAQSAPARSASWRSIRRGSSAPSAVRPRRGAGSTSGCRSSSACPDAPESTANDWSHACWRATGSRRRRRSIRRSRSALAEPLSSAEATLLTALAPLAANSPRAAKRFLNAYRLARCAYVPRPAVALMQAVAFADDETQAAMRRRLASGGGDLEPVDGPDALVRAVKSARAANGGALTVADARAADAVARRYALSL